MYRKEKMIKEHKESVEVKRFKENRKNAELFTPIKPWKKHKKEGT